MATRVTLCALSPVKIIYVTYKMEHAWSVNLEYMVVTALSFVPPPVMTTRVIDRMVHALHVNLVGLGYTVKQNVQMGGTVSTVATNAQCVVEPTLHVIT